MVSMANTGYSVSAEVRSNLEDLLVKRHNYDIEPRRSACFKQHEEHKCYASKDIKELIKRESTPRDLQRVFIVLQVV